jgi:uncharacterized protein YifE (UPF0438 family)
MTQTSKTKKPTIPNILSNKKPTFKLDGFDGIYSTEELHILKQRGQKLLELSLGIAKPKNYIQRRFIAVIKGEQESITIAESAWLKYTHRKEIIKEFQEKEKFFRQAFKTLKVSDEIITNNIND